jgi:hypothetical protein
MCHVLEVSRSAFYTWLLPHTSKRQHRQVQHEVAVHAAHMQTQTDAKQGIMEYIEIFYNQQRRHSRLGNVAPVVFCLLRHLSEKVVFVSDVSVSLIYW